MNIYWFTITKISVCEGCEGCRTRKSGPVWHVVREPPMWPPGCVYPRPSHPGVCTGGSVSEVHKLFSA